MTKKKRREAPKKRTQAVLIHPNEGSSYADILKGVRKKVMSENPDTDVKYIRRTRAGDVLIELGTKEQKKNQAMEVFGKFIQSAVGQASIVKQLSPRLYVEIRDLDCFTTESEVETAIQKVFTNEDKDAGEVKVTLTEPTTREQHLAVVEMDQDEALHLIEKKKIRVGYISCRMRQWARILRCFRCLGYGYQARYCQGPDRSKIRNMKDFT